MQDKKYIPIIALVILLSLIVLIAYLLFVQRKERSGVAEEMIKTTLESLKVISKERAATKEEIEATLESLQATGEGGVSEEELNQALQSLSTPAE